MKVNAEVWLRRAAFLLLGGIVMAMMTVTTIDVVGRYAFNSPLSGAQELTELCLALMVFGAAPLVASDRAHITTDLMESAIRGRVRQVRDASVGVLSGVACIVLAWRIGDQARSMSAMSGHTPLLGIPIGPILYVCAAMCGVCAVISFLQALRASASR